MSHSRSSSPEKNKMNIDNNKSSSPEREESVEKHDSPDHKRSSKTSDMHFSHSRSHSQSRSRKKYRSRSKSYSSHSRSHSHSQKNDNNRSRSHSNAKKSSSRKTSKRQKKDDKHHHEHHRSSKKSPLKKHHNDKHHHDTDHRRRQRHHSPSYESVGNRARNSHSRSNASSNALQSRIVFVGNLPRGIQKYDLEETFLNTRYNMSVDRIDLKGSYAFVHLRGKHIDKCIRSSNPIYWHGVRLTVEFAKSNEIQKWEERKFYHTNRTLFVVNFDEDQVRQNDIENLFGKYGSLRRVSVRRNFAFVEFEELDDAKKAKDKLQGFHYRGKDLIVRYAASPDDKVREDELNERQNRRRALIAARNQNGDGYGGRFGSGGGRDGQQRYRSGSRSYSRSPSRSGSRGRNRRRSPSPFYYRRSVSRSRSRNNRRRNRRSFS